MTPADPCTGARWRDFLRGIRRGQPVGAHVPSWCSRHEVDAWSLPTGGPAWLAYDFCLPDAADGTGWTPSATADPGSDRIGGAALLFNGEIAMTPIRISLDIAK